MITLFILCIALMAVLAYANGSNDVSKAIATLVGSGVTNYPRALAWGTLWTTAGSLLAASFAWQMVKTFTGGWLSKGAELTVTFPLAVLIGAITWVLLSTWTGLPVSTTHAITGALLGAGILAYGAGMILWSSLVGKIFLPLLLSPVIALALTFALFPLIKLTLANRKGYCFCFGVKRTVAVPSSSCSGSELNVINETGVMYPEPMLASREFCGNDFAYSLNFNLNTLHWLSSGAASFARGLNDAPKIVALMATFGLIRSNSVSKEWSLFYFILVATAMGLGSYLYGLRVTAVLAERVTSMNHTEGFAANLTTAFLVATAAHFGLPVSTTHVSTSAIIGVGLRKGIQWVSWKTVGNMVLAWVVTLPAAGLFAALAYYVFVVIK